MVVTNISSGAEKVIRVAGFLVGIAGIVLVVGMMLLTVADVILRAAFNRPIIGSTEVTQLMLERRRVERSEMERKKKTGEV